MWVESRGRVRCLGKGRESVWRCGVWVSIWAVNNRGAIDCPTGLWPPVLEWCSLCSIRTRGFYNLYRDQIEWVLVLSPALHWRRSLTLTTRLRWSGRGSGRERKCGIQRPQIQEKFPKELFNSVLLTKQFKVRGVYSACLFSLFAVPSELVCNHNTLQKLPLHMYLLDEYRWRASAKAKAGDTVGWENQLTSTSADCGTKVKEGRVTEQEAGSFWISLRKGHGIVNVSAHTI